MNSLQTFEFKPVAYNVRTVIYDGEVWFVAKDICDALGLDNVSKACSRLDDDEKLVSLLVISGQGREVLTVNESGLYNLIFTSNKPEAKAFRKWVTSEVLPSIRKTGKYEAIKHPFPLTTLQRDQLMLNSLAEAIKTHGDGEKVHFSFLKESFYLGIGEMKTASKNAIYHRSKNRLLNNKKIGFFDDHYWLIR